MSNFEELLDLIGGKDVKDVLRNKLKKDIGKGSEGLRSEGDLEGLEKSEKDIGKGKVKRKRDKRLKQNKSKPKNSMYMKDKFKRAKREKASRDALLRKYRAGKIDEKELGTLKEVIDLDLIKGDKETIDKTPKKVFSKGKGEQLLKIINQALELRERNDKYGFEIETVDGFDKIELDNGTCELGLDGHDTFKAKVRRPMLIERGGKIYKVFTATKLTDSFLVRNATLNYLDVFNEVDGVIFIQNESYSYKTKTELRSIREKSKGGSGKGKVVGNKGSGSKPFGKGDVINLKKQKVGYYNREKEIAIINEKREKERKERALQVMLDKMTGHSDEEITIDDVNVDVDDYTFHIVSGKAVYQELYDRLYKRLLNKGTLNNAATIHLSRHFPIRNGVAFGRISNAIIDN